MHPVLNSRVGMGAWVAAWVAAAGVFWLIGHEALPALMLAGLLALLCITPYWLCRALPLSSTRPWKLVGAHLVDGMLISAVAVYTVQLFGGSENWGEVRLAMGAVAFAFDLLVVAVYYTGLGIDASRRADLLMRESQLKALKSQVNPHFLFNSLNSIAALAGQDAERAREMCVRLADFLRTSLKLGERAIIPLAEELALTRMYLDVEQVRFGGRLRFVENVAEECRPLEVPSLAIQPLVENAVKHGVAMMAEGGEIRLEGALHGARMRLTVSNPFDPEAPMQQRTGIGLRNLGARLEAVYGGNAEMLVQPQERAYRVTLDLPARKAKDKAKL